jgi:hypothetical protein
VYDRLLALIRKEWWTDVAVKTDAKGEASIPAFFGDYEVEATRGAEARTGARALVRHARKTGRTETELKLP